MTATISVVTPSYNQGRFIDRTIRSVLEQGVPSLEYVVFDGGSTDDTLDVLRTYDGRVRWSSAPDKGQSDAVNKGIRATHGDIVGWLNSDDIYYPGALSEVLQYFDEHPDVDVVYGMSNHIDAQDAVIEPYPTEPWNFERLKETCFISQPATFFRRSAVERWGVIDQRLQYCMDYEFWLRLGLAGANFAYLPRLLAATRIHEATKTNASRLKCHREINQMMAKKFGAVPDRWIFNFAHAAIEDRGFTRDRQITFILMLLLHSYTASLRFNWHVSRGVLTITKGWFLDVVRLTARKARLVA
jgi:glycosyltransferase involved in cell wall biosynthesis